MTFSKYCAFVGVVVLLDVNGWLLLLFLFAHVFFIYFLLLHLLAWLMDLNVLESICIVEWWTPVLVKAFHMRCPFNKTTLVRVTQIVTGCSTFLTPLAYLFQFQRILFWWQCVPKSVYLLEGVVGSCLAFSFDILVANRYAKAKEAVLSFRFCCFSVILTHQVVEAVLNRSLAAESGDQVFAHIAHFWPQTVSHFAFLTIYWIGVLVIWSSVHALIYFVSFLWCHFLHFLPLPIFVSTEGGLKVEPKLQITMVPLFLLFFQILCKDLVVNLLGNLLE